MTDCYFCAIFGLAGPVIWYLGTSDQVMIDHLGQRIPGISAFNSGLYLKSIAEPSYLNKFIEGII